MTKLIKHHKGNIANKLIPVKYCYQVNYMSKNVHEYVLIEWTPEFVKFKWQNEQGKWRKGKTKFYPHDIDEKWFKTEKEANDFVINNYDKTFLFPRQNKR